MAGPAPSHLTRMYSLSHQETQAGPGFGLFYVGGGRGFSQALGALEGKCFHLGPRGRPWAWLTFLQPWELAAH